MINVKSVLAVPVALIWIAFAAASGASDALAERVLVKTQSGSKGQGWLFSDWAARDGACWLAMPKHVVAEPGSEELSPVVFTDLSGSSGESGVPVEVSSVPGGLEATNGEEDLAFAPVEFGRERGGCPSGLGLPQLAYTTALRQSSRLTAMNLLRTSFGIFDVRVARAKLDAAGGGLLALRPARESDADEHMKAGLSGAVAEVNYKGENYPFAMVLEVRREANLAFGLRFDLIKNAFERFRQAYKKREAGRQNQDWSTAIIMGFDGEPVQGSVGLSALERQGDGCWTARARVGQSSVSIELTTPEKQKVLNGVSVITSSTCEGRAGRVIIEQRPDSSSDWNVATECSIVEDDGGQAACYMDYIAPRQLRLVFPTRDSVSISQIRIY